ncbi:MAG: hypothetical protein ACK4HV_00880 [Parachlamydiaceae bacterium]
MDTPPEWKRIDIERTDDTTKPIAEFHTADCKIVIHNFPNMPIPANAQIARWKKQNPKAIVTPIAFSGYTGFLLEDKNLIAIAINVSQKGEKGAPVTLKATGPFNHDKMKKALMTFETVEPIQ